MVHVGAPVPLAIMVIAWGAVSAGTSGINNTGTFYLVRFLLGLCEGGCGACTIRVLLAVQSFNAPLLQRAETALLGSAGHSRAPGTTSAPSSTL